MISEFQNLKKIAFDLGYKGSKDSVYSIRDWLREEHSIHVEVGSIWDESNNQVESYFYTISSPINIYYTEPVYCSGSGSHSEMLIQSVGEGLKLLKKYQKQKDIQVSDDEIVIAYLKGYSDKNKKAAKCPYATNIEEYAYLHGKQGDYIEEGLTDDDIVYLVRNNLQDQEQYRLK